MLRVPNQIERGRLRARNADLAGRGLDADGGSLREVRFLDEPDTGTADFDRPERPVGDHLEFLWGLVRGPVQGSRREQPDVVWTAEIGHEFPDKPRGRDRPGRPILQGHDDVEAPAWRHDPAGPGKGRHKAFLRAIWDTPRAFRASSLVKTYRPEVWRPSTKAAAVPGVAPGGKGSRRARRFVTDRSFSLVISRKW